MTTAMYIAEKCKQIPDKHWNHGPRLQNNHKFTVAMYLAYNEIIPPK